MTLSVKEIKQFHQSYNRLTLLDHVILSIVESDKIAEKRDIYDQVFKQYRQITYAELTPHLQKLLRLGLIEFNYYLNHYLLTKDGISELEFVKDFVKQKK